MEHLETDISYMLGRYLGVARRIEIELDRLTKKENPSAIEAHFDDFPEKPAESLRKCQASIEQDQMVLGRVKGNDLILECNEIYKMVNVEALEHITLNGPNFLHGYHVQLATYSDEESED